jgi:RNA polymerase sigma factor (TIGR02999 family)
MTPAHGEVTQLVLDWSSGDPDAFDRLVPLVYDDLRHIARKHLRRHGSGETINPTALVHELYLNLVDQTRVGWRDRAHLFAVASKAMRHILIDYVRRKGAVKRGGDRVRVPLLPDMGSVDPITPDLLALDEALTDLEKKDPRLARTVECRFFGGMTAKETAEVLGVGLRTVERDWTRARAYLFRALTVGDQTSD